MDFFGNKLSDDESEDEEEKTRKEAVVAKWKQQARALQQTNSHVYLLMREEQNHARRGGEAKTLVGVYDSKEAAVAASMDVETGYGTFDSAIADDFKDDHVDNRETPPDDGILIQIGSEDAGEGDLVRLLIERIDVLGLEEESSSKEAPKKGKGQKKRRL
jgi:hypothetical protein